MAAVANPNSGVAMAVWSARSATSLTAFSAPSVASFAGAARAVAVLATVVVANSNSPSTIVDHLSSTATNHDANSNPLFHAISSHNVAHKRKLTATTVMAMAVVAALFGIRCAQAPDSVVATVVVTVTKGEAPLMAAVVATAVAADTVAVDIVTVAAVMVAMFPTERGAGQF